MKIIKSFFLVSFFLVNHNLLAQAIFQKGTVIIAGEINQPSSELMGIISKEVMGRNTYSAKINPDGSFKVSFQMLSEHDIYLNYNNDLVTLLLAPGDSIFLTAKGHDFENSIKFYGDKASSNKVVGLFFDLYEMKSRGKKFFYRMRLEPDEFREYVDGFYPYLGKISETIIANHEADPATANWIRTYIKYAHAYDLFKYGIKSVKNLPQNYYDFADEYKMKDINDLKCSMFYEWFLSLYYNIYQLPRFDENEDLRLLRENEQYCDKLELTFELLAKNEKMGIIAETFITREYEMFLRYRTYDCSNTCYQKYQALVSNRDYQAFIAKKINQKKVASSQRISIEELAEMEFIGDLFAEIQEKHQGKVLYVDFWGTGCGPCIREFPNSKLLKEQLQDKDIEFVYLCDPTENDKWKAAIAKYQLQGDNYLLTKDQKTSLRHVFNFNGIPRYLIVDKEGSFVDKNAPRPSSKFIKNTLVKLSEM